MEKKRVRNNNINERMNLNDGQLTELLGRLDRMLKKRKTTELNGLIAQGAVILPKRTRVSTQKKTQEQKARECREKVLKKERKRLAEERKRLAAMMNVIANRLQRIKLKSKLPETKRNSNPFVNPYGV